jgi:sugar (pentulose or hexulose) kinase
MEDDRHDYVVWKLCGVCVTDSTTASTTGLTDLSFKYATGLMHDVGLGHWIDKLPLIHPPTSLVVCSLNCIALV